MIHCNWCGGLGDAQVVQVPCKRGVDLYMMHGRVFGSVGIAQTPKHPLGNCLLQHFASSTTFNSLKNGLCCFIDHCLLYLEDTSLMKVVQRKKHCNNMCVCGVEWGCQVGWVKISYQQLPRPLQTPLVADQREGGEEDRGGERWLHR